MDLGWRTCHATDRTDRESRVNEPKKRASKASPADEGGDRRYMVPGLSRGLAALRLFNRQKPEQNLTDVADGLGLSRSAAYRLLYTLENERFVSRDPNTRRYRLTSKVLSLGFEYLYGQPLTDVAQPFLRQVSDATGATAYLVILEGWQAVYLARVAPASFLVTNLQIGARYPAHLVASGRSILAHLPDERLKAVYESLKRESKDRPVPARFPAFEAIVRADRDAGYSFNRSIFEPTVSALSCAVQDRSGAPVAALNIVAPHSVFDDAGGEKKLGKVVGEVAHEFSRRLGLAG